MWLHCLTFVFGSTLVEAVSVAYRTRRGRPVALLNTHRHTRVHEKATTAMLRRKTNRFVFNLSHCTALEPRAKYVCETILREEAVL